jgi:hypothetical protein
MTVYTTDMAICPVICAVTLCLGRGEFWYYWLAARDGKKRTGKNACATVKARFKSPTLEE